ncbi:MAG: FHA domain-containing protein [Planctomycetes bacterium]|nr:FHA domain-containing protein [Planctomycetota bacterium]
MSYLEIVDGQGRRRQVDLNRPRLLIGREPTCDIHLPHPGVSRRHAQLQLTDQGRWLLQDLRSRNHVYVDNRPVQQIILDARKPFRIAEYWLALHDETPWPTRGAIEEILEDTADTGLRQEDGWLEQLHALQKDLAVLEDPHLVLDRLAREFRRVLQPKLVAIGLAKLDGYTWEVILADDQQTSLKSHLEDADQKVAEDHSSFHSWVVGEKTTSEKTTSEKPPFDKQPAETPTPMPPTCLLFPMKGRTGIIGHVYVMRPGFAPLPRALRTFLGMVTTHAGLMWDNLQLGVLRQAQIEFEKELHAARQIQIDLFPHTFEVDPRLDAYAVNLPSARVSGDYYDLIRISPDTVAFVIADAMGHGMPAALLMAAVRAALRMGLSLGLPWAAIFQGLDDLIHQARGDTFVTGMIGMLDLHTRDLQLVSAGHPLPSILVDGKPVPIPDQCLTRPWGLDIESYWEVSRLPLKGKQFSILCYTDGITDAAARSQRTFGAQRIATYHQQNFHDSAEDLCQGLLTEVAVQPGAALGDDQTVLVLCGAGKRS